MTGLACRLEQCIGFAAQRVALGVLRTVVDQTDTRVCDALDLLHVERAHHAELQEIFGSALGVCACVDEQYLTALAGHDRCDRTAAHALDALAEQGCTRQQRTGRTCADNRVCLALLDQIQCHCHGRLRLCTQNGGRVVVHVYQIGCMQDGDARGVLSVMRLEHCVDLVLLSDQNDFFVVVLCGTHRTADNGLGRVVAAHRVYCNLHLSSNSFFMVSITSSARSEIFAFFSRLPRIL